MLPGTSLSVLFPEPQQQGQGLPPPPLPPPPGSAWSLGRDTGPVPGRSGDGGTAGGAPWSRKAIHKASHALHMLALLIEKLILAKHRPGPLPGLTELQLSSAQVAEPLPGQSSRRVGRCDGSNSESNPGAWLSARLTLLCPHQSHPDALLAHPSAGASKSKPRFGVRDAWVQTFLMV